MKRTRVLKKYLESSDSEDDIPLKKTNSKELNTKQSYTESSSESDIENYLLKPEKLDLDSEFFSRNLSKVEKVDIKKTTDLTNLSDSELEVEKENEVKESNEISKPKTSKISSSKMNFNHLQDYTKNIEEAKRYIEIYKAKKQAEENKTDILNLLVSGEKNTGIEKSLNLSELHSSDFESCGSEQEEWEEIKTKGRSENLGKKLIPETNLQITVDMPDNVKKKKGVDLLAAMKRRLNRIRKENQVLVHKVHLLCWLAHGNFINSSINNSEILAMALSLLPSEQCYPSDRIDLSYLEQIVKWYKRTVKLVEQAVPDDISVNEFIKFQISNKVAHNKNMFVFIFIAILRALGVQCRIVMSFQVEALRPPTAELHKVSTRCDDNKQNKQQKCTLQNKIQNTASKTSLPNKKASFEDSHCKETTKLNKKKSTKDIKVSKKNIVNTANREKLEVLNIDHREDLNSLKTRKCLINKTHSIKSELNNKIKTELSSNKSKEKCLELGLKSMRTRTITIRNNKDKKKIKESVSPENISQNGKNKLPDINRSKTRLRTQTEKNDLISTKSSKAKKSSAKKHIAQVDGIYDSHSENEIILLQVDGANDKKKKSKKIASRLKLPTTSNEMDSESEYEPTNKRYTRRSQKRIEERSDKLDVRDDIINLIKLGDAEQKRLDKNRLAKRSKSYLESKLDSREKKCHESDEDFVPKSKIAKKVESGRSVLSESEQELEKKENIKKGNDVWLEVFLEAEEKWISVDVIHGQVHCVKEIYQRASHPVSYVVSWDNNNKIKDVTQRYCPNFHTITRKQRIDSKWWDDSLKPFKGIPTARDQEEDNDLARQQLDQPLPKAITEYKNHPLYALKRNLLKFEALYPPEPPILGFVRGEAVYPRSCVYTLHSRDIWLKQAKVVKLGEQPYKIVKARPKYDKLSNKVITDQTLEIFGPWQVQDYEPPTAENGIVPKNAFGNVDLFKPCMLPKGCVHLRLPGLNKITRKMNIDCAAAIVGFDFHGGWSHPVYDGFVVCKEYEDELICAWELEQDELEKKEEEKINKRVYGNWKKLIKGLLIRERLKAKYDFGEASTSSSNKKKMISQTSKTK